MRRTWPWFTTILAAALCGFPLTWAIVGAAVRQSPTDWFRQLWLTVSLIGAAVLVALALAEWLVRRWLIRRRDGGPPAARSG